MWKPEHRLANGRRDLRYPSDLSDAEWVLVAPLIPPAGAADGGGRSTSAKTSTLSSMCSRPAANGRLCRKICRRKARRISIFRIGMARWTVSTRRFMSRSARRLGERRARVTRSSTPTRAPRRPKRGSSLAPQGFDAGRKVTGRKRHMLVDTLGLLLGVSVLPANI